MMNNFPAYYHYLEDIRRRLNSLVKVFIVLFAVGFLNSGPILKFIVRIFRVENADIVTTSPFQFLDLAMSVGIYTGLILCTPLFIYHLYGFLKDGLNKSEKRFFFVLLPVSSILFCIGFLYSFTILYFTLNSVAAFNVGLGIKNLWDISRFLLQIILTSVFLGVIFQFPIILTFMVRVGLVGAAFLREKRRHAIALMFILTSLLPPTDGLSLLIMVVPLIVMYEVTIRVASLVERRSQTHRLVGSEKITY